MKNNEAGKKQRLTEPREYIQGHVLARWLMPVVVLLATFASYLPVLSNGFVEWDDHENLVNNQNYRGVGWSQLRWMFTTFHMGHYQPLSWLTLGLDYLLWGMNPTGYHFTSLLIHAANGVIFYYVSRCLLTIAAPVPNRGVQSGYEVAAAMAALLFAVHPLRVESVVWATERRDVLSGLFFFGAIYCYLRAHTAAHREVQVRWLTFVFINYTLSLLAKATAITLPIVLLLLDVYPLKRIQGGIATWFKPEIRQVLAEKLPFLVLSLLFGLAAIFAQQSAGALRSVEQYFVTYRLGQAFYGICFYLWKTIAPINLSPLYELPFDFDAWMPLFAVCAGLVVAVTLALYFFRRRWPALLAGWIYYVVVLSPVLGVAQSGPQLAADRYTYLSCLSWAVLAGGSFFYHWKTIEESRHRQAVLVATCAVVSLVVVLLGILTWTQIGVWRDTKTLWQHVLTVTPNSSAARYNVGKMFENDGKIEDAVEYYSRAVSINPANADAHYNLARLLAKRGMQDEAVEHYRQALRTRPDDADTHNNLGLLLLRKGQVEASLMEFRKAVQIDPNYAKGFFNMARVYDSQGDLGNAVSYYQKALKLRPEEFEIHLGLGSVLARKERLEEAAHHFRSAVTLNPQSTEAHIGLARVLAPQGKKDEAEKHYQEALRILRLQSGGRDERLPSR